MRVAEILSLIYFAYLTVVATTSGTWRARTMSVTALALVAIVELVFVRMETPLLMLVREVWPLALLFAGYRMAGMFYEQPDTKLEARLLHVDRWLGRRLSPSPRGAGRANAASVRVAAEWLEAAYLGVYLIIPLGAVVVTFDGPAGAVDRFWSAVLASGFVCYGALPWIQTRPPRAIEGSAAFALSGPSLQPSHGRRDDGPGDVGLRRLNLLILEHGSVGVNTLPSGHAATAVATALAVTTSAPSVGVLFLAAALFIALATVVGRYHYTVDTVLGAIVGIVAWVVFVT